MDIKNISGGKMVAGQRYGSPAPAPSRGGSTSSRPTPASWARDASSVRCAPGQARRLPEARREQQRAGRRQKHRTDLEPDDRVRAPVIAVSAASASSSPAAARYTHARTPGADPPAAVAAITTAAMPHMVNASASHSCLMIRRVIPGDRLKPGQDLPGRHRVRDPPGRDHSDAGIGQDRAHTPTLTGADARAQGPWSRRPSRTPNGRGISRLDIREIAGSRQHVVAHDPPRFVRFFE